MDIIYLTGELTGLNSVIMDMTPKTLLEAVKFFANPENCREYMVSRRWPNGVTCPQCGSETVYFDRIRNGWECKTRHPKRKFTLKTGTIFEDSPLGFDKWLPCVWLIANARTASAATRLRRAHRRHAKDRVVHAPAHPARDAGRRDGGGKLGGEVEVDETYIGGKARNMHAAKRKTLMSTFARTASRRSRIAGPARCRCSACWSGASTARPASAP